MTIKELTITELELQEAVGMFLKTRGINVPPTNVKKNYGNGGGFAVEFEEVADVVPPPFVKAATTTEEPL